MRFQRYHGLSLSVDFKLELERILFQGRRKAGNLVQYVWGQYAMHNLGANSARPPVDKFTNFMVGRNPLVIERLLPHSKFQVASSQGASFFSPKILLSFVLDFTVLLRHARNK